MEIPYGRYQIVGWQKVVWNVLCRKYQPCGDQNASIDFVQSGYAFRQVKLVTIELNSYAEVALFPSFSD